MANGSDKGTAAEACEMLATLYAVLQRQSENHSTFSFLLPDNAQKELKTKVLNLLRQAIELDPSRERSWDMLTALLAEQTKSEEVIAVARKRVERQDTARNRLLLAKALVIHKQFDEATSQLRAGLKCEPRDPDCCRGLAAMLLKRDDAKSLKEAGEQLDTVKEPTAGTNDKARRMNYLLMPGLSTALNARPDPAKAMFKQILQHDNGNASAAR